MGKMGMIGKDGDRFKSRRALNAIMDAISRMETVIVSRLATLMHSFFLLLYQLYYAIIVSRLETAASVFH